MTHGLTSKRRAAGTRQERARAALVSEGILSAADIAREHLGRYPARNARIVQAVIFDGYSVRGFARRVGLSSESVRRVALSVTRRAIGRFEGAKKGGAAFDEHGMDRRADRHGGGTEMTRIRAAHLRDLMAKNRTARPRADRERPVHLACLHYLQVALPGAVIHHSANELELGGDAKAKAIAQAKAKALGMRPGWPDIEVLWHGQFWTFEVKADDNGPTKEQRECGADIVAQGGRWAVVRSVDDVRACLDEWMPVGPESWRVVAAAPASPPPPKPRR